MPRSKTYSPRQDPAFKGDIDHVKIQTLFVLKMLRKPALESEPNTLILRLDLKTHQHLVNITDFI